MTWSRPPQPIEFEGVTYSSRLALARHLAPAVGRIAKTVESMLRAHGDDGAAVLRAYANRHSATVTISRPNDRPEFEMAAGAEIGAPPMPILHPTSAWRSQIVCLQRQGLGYRAIARKLGLTVGQVAGFLYRTGKSRPDDQNGNEKPGRTDPGPAAVAGSRVGIRMELSFRGHTYPTQRALARQLAPLVQRSFSSVKEILCKLGNDGEAVIQYYQDRPHPGRRPQVYEGRAFNSRAALARYLAPRIGRPANAICKTLGNHHDNLPAVLAIYGRIAVTAGNETFVDRAAFMRALRRRYSIPESKLNTWIYTYKLPPEEVKDRASAWRREHKPRLPRDQVVLFGWRFRSYKALCAYYRAPYQRRAWQEHLDAGKKPCLFVPLAEAVARLWEFSELDEWNRRAPDAETQLPKSCLPLNAEPEEIVDPMERAMVDALQPAEAMTWRRGMMRGHERFLKSIGAG